MRRRDFLRLAGMGAAAVSLGSAGAWCQARSGADKPNIIFIMVDDLGKEWVSCYGAEDIETPHIDALAAGGMRFENAYSMPQCTPSRVTLLTGQYPWRTGWVNHWDVPRWGVGYFDWRHHTTVAQLLKRAGYATAAAGKWQINDFRVTPDALKKHGFDEWCMWTGGEGGNPPSDERYWDPYIHTGHQSKTHKGKFGPDIYTQFLIDFAGRHKDEPMFLYFPMCLTHGPLVATPDEPDVTEKTAKHKAMVRYMDKLVGQLVAALERLIQDGESKLKMLLRDEWDDIRVVAAEALGYLGETELALETMQSVIDGEETFATVAALNALDYMMQAGQVSVKRIQAMVKGKRFKNVSGRVVDYFNAMT